MFIFDFIKIKLYYETMKKKNIKIIFLLYHFKIEKYKMKKFKIILMYLQEHIRLL